MKIQVCTGKTCKGRFSEYILKRIESDKEKFNLENIITEITPCMGHCQKGPNVSIDGKVEHYSEGAKISKIILEKLKIK